MVIKGSVITAGMILWLAASSAEAASLTSAHTEQGFELPGFGQVTIFRPPSTAESVALFLSPAAGWSDWDTSAARVLAKADTLVAGIDTRQFLSVFNGQLGQCVDPAATLEDVASSLKKEFAVRDFIQPMIVGHGEGAAIAYNALAQPGHHSFKGAVAMEYCPILQNTRPICTPVVNQVGASTNDHPSSQLTAPLNVLQFRNSSCAADVNTSLASMPGSELISVDSDPSSWITRGAPDQLVDAYWQIAGTDSSFRGVKRSASAIADLPLTEIRDPARAESDTFAILLSGDGGWADLDQGVAKELTRRGIPVIGLSSLKYFWTPRKPEELAADISRIASHYLDAWHKDRFLIAGYSFGADVAPFVPKRLPPDVADKLIGVALVAPSRNASFEFHVSEWLGITPSGSPTAPEITSLHPMPVACLYGADDTDTVCPALTKEDAKVIKLQGDHHFNGNYSGIANAIAALRR